MDLFGRKPKNNPIQVSGAHARALDLLAAIDQGGIPLNPLIVNQVARNLGLDVATTDLMPHTIERMRQYLDTQEKSHAIFEAP